MSVRFKFETFDPEFAVSIAAMPSVDSIEPMYADDPALFNIYLVTASSEDAQSVLESIATFDEVEFVEVIPKPEIR